MMNLFYVTGKQRGLGKYWSDHYLTTDNPEEADIIFNCEHEKQMRILHEYGKTHRVITIGSHASDFPYKSKYHAMKYGIRMLSGKLWDEGYNTTCINFGYFESPRAAHKQVPKMKLSEVEDVIMWVIQSQHRIKEITISP